MATITITIPDAVAPRVLDAVTGTFASDFVASGLTKAQYVKSYIVKDLKSIVRAYEAGLASSTAADSATAAVEQEIQLT